MRADTDHPPGAAQARTPRRRRSRARAQNLLLLAVSLVLGLICLELVLGLTPYRDLTKPRSDYPPGYFVDDPELGADIATSYPPAPFRMRGPAFDVFSNRWDCFDHDDPVGEGYVLAVGDSSTWGYAPLEDKWTSHLEALSGRRVLKCGVPGTGPRYQQIKARKTIALVGIAPAVLVVLYDTWNDLNDDVVFPGYGVVEGYRGHTLESLDLRDGTLARHTPEAFAQKYRRYVDRRSGFYLQRFLVEHLTTAAMISFIAEAPRQQAAPADGPILRQRYDFSLWQADSERYPWLIEAVENHLDSLRDLQRLADEQGAALVLVTDGIPQTGLHRRLSAFLDSEIRYHLDVAAPIAEAAEGRATRYRFDPHWNPLGNRLAAEIIHRYLTDQGLI